MTPEERLATCTTTCAACGKDLVKPYKDASGVRIFPDISRLN